MNSEALPAAVTTGTDCPARQAQEADFQSAEVPSMAQEFHQISAPLHSNLSVSSPPQAAASLSLKRSAANYWPLDRRFRKLYHQWEWLEVIK